MMIYNFTRNSRVFRVCVSPFVVGEGIPDMIINGNGCWIEETIKGTRLKVHVFRGHGFDAQYKTQYIKWWRYDLDKVDFEHINNRLKDDKNWNDTDLYDALANITDTFITTEQDIFRRSVNGILESEGLVDAETGEGYLFDETLQPIGLD